MRVRKHIFLFAFSIVTLISASLFYIQEPREVQRIMGRFFPSPTPQPLVIKGIGVIGDSLSDEYQADDARGYAYAPTTLNWVEQLVKSRRLNFGMWNTWGDVRRTGFAYNWSRSGANSSSMIANGQHTGLSQQIAAGEVNLAILYIGGNDFGPHNTEDGFFPIYNETLTGKELTSKINTVVTNTTSAMDTLKNAGRGDIHIIVVTVPDWNSSASVQVALTNEAGKQRVSDVITVVNEKIATEAKKRNISVLDINSFYTSLLADALLGSFTLDGKNISLLVPQDDPEHAFLSDAIHPGTVLNGLFANYVIEHMRSVYNVPIEPLTDKEIAENAGL